jgi:hypothetical protein
VLDATSTAVGALLGITSSRNQEPAAVGEQWAPTLLAVAIALAAWRVRRLGGVPSGVWRVLGIGLTFWILAAFSENGFRQPDNGRYLYPSGVFLLLIASELLRGVRPRTRALVAAGAVTAMAVVANLAFLSDSYRFREHESQTDQAELTALEIAGPVNPAFDLDVGLAVEINSRSYLSAVESWGSPAYSEAELASKPQDARIETDRTLRSALDLRLEPDGTIRRPCRTIQPSAGGAPGLQIGPSTIALMTARNARARVSLGRFSDGLPLDLGPLRPGSRVSLAIPPDGSARPWRLGFEGRGPVTVCGPGAP